MTFAIVVDLEATCTDKNEFPREEMEIIEIGAVCLDSDNNVRDTFQTFIRPLKHPQLTEFCKELTTIKQTDVDLAYTFNTAMPQFLQWVKNVTGRNDYVFYSWGNFDKNIFRRQCIENNVDARIFLSKHRNAKTVFATEHRLKKEVGVGGALKIKKMEFMGTPHRADSDAHNIARLVSTLKERQ